ncbi:MAG: ATP-binding cassette domain-containing protein [Anaerosomatales bacterium]|nr:ATP-binding cassette domain-containing protein [Anaerosomatales bacterium]
MDAIVTERLTKRFGDLTAVDRLDLRIPSGGVVGFVGPNGSGKSTTIRMLLGLLKPTAGTAHVLGAPISNPARYAHRVGALIESPAFVPGLSARANLRSLAALRGLPMRRVDEVLEIVGLSGRARDLVRTYSLGMKQRLAIAAALLPDPDLLVLDEPTNGLDPAGVVEIRTLLMELGREGRTLLVSSHLLSEIEAACDRVVVIRFGKMLYSGSLVELKARTSSRIALAPEHDPDVPRLTDLCVARGYAVRRANGELVVEAPAEAAAELNRAAAQAGITLRKLVASEQSLEDAFLRMTGADAGGDRRARTGPGARAAHGSRGRTAPARKEGHDA